MYALTFICGNVHIPQLRIRKDLLNVNGRSACYHELIPKWHVTLPLHLMSLLLL